MTKSNNAKIVHVGEFEHVIRAEWKEHEIIALADEFLNWMEEDESRIWFRDFLLSKRISTRTISRLRERNDYFDEIYQLVKDIQEARLVHLGLTNPKLATFAIWTMKNVSGWRDKPDESEDIPDHELIVDWPGMEQTNE